MKHHFRNTRLCSILKYYSEYYVLSICVHGIHDSPIHFCDFVKKSMNGIRFPSVGPAA